MTKEWKKMISKRSESELNNFIDSYAVIINNLNQRTDYIKEELLRRQNETSGTNYNNTNGIV